MKDTPVFERPKAIPIPKLEDVTPRDVIEIPKPGSDVRVQPIDIPSVNTDSGGERKDVVDDGTSPINNDI